MKLTLSPGGYQWRFHPVKAADGQPHSGLSYSDSGSAKCHS